MTKLTAYLLQGNAARGKNRPVAVSVNHYHTFVKLHHIEEIDSHTEFPEFVMLKLGALHRIHDTLGDGQWHQWVVADRARVALILNLDRGQS